MTTITTINAVSNEDEGVNEDVPNENNNDNNNNNFGNVNFNNSKLIVKDPKADSAQRRTCNMCISND